MLTAKFFSLLILHFRYAFDWPTWPINQFRSVRLVARLPNVKISRPQVAALVRRLDRDRSGMLTVDEMEKALRDARMKNRGIEMCAHARARDALDHKQLGGVLPELLRKRRVSAGRGASKMRR